MTRNVREEILDAAERCFYGDGITATGVDALADHAGVSKRTLYNHFPTKQDILKDLMLSHMAELLDAWETCDLPDSMDPLERFVRFHIRYHLEKTDEVFISYMELRNLEPANFDVIETERRRYEAILTRILEEGAATGRYAVTEPKVTTRALIAMLTGIPSWYRAGGRLSKQDIEELYLELARKAVAADATPSLTGDRMT